MGFVTTAKGEEMRINLNTFLYLMVVVLFFILIAEMRQLNRRVGDIQEKTSDVLTMTTVMYTQGRVGMEVK